MSSLHNVGAPREKLAALEKIERDIGSAVQSAGMALQELSKDKPAVKQVESHTSNFLKTLQEIDSGLSTQISYLSQVSTGQPHEGSSYASKKDNEMAQHRLEHVRSRLGEMEKMKTEHIRQRSNLSRALDSPMPQQQQMLSQTQQQRDPSKS